MYSPARRKAEVREEGANSRAVRSPSVHSTRPRGHIGNLTAHPLVPPSRLFPPLLHSYPLIQFFDFPLRAYSEVTNPSAYTILSTKQKKKKNKESNFLPKVFRHSKVYRSLILAKYVSGISIDVPVSSIIIHQCIKNVSSIYRKISEQPNENIFITIRILYVRQCHRFLCDSFAV